MRTGLTCGGRGAAFESPALSLFRDNEDGFTSVAVALALLLSLTLVFSAAAAGWVSARSSEVQRVADAAALAGENAVAAFSTVVQVVDACALSLGLTGILSYGAGIVASCVPGLGSVGAELCSTGSSVLQARRDFVSSASQGIERLEETLPLLVVANSSSCVTANSEKGLSYTGCALPFPTESQSNFSALANEVDDAGLDSLSEEMRDASLEAEELKRESDDALLRGWMADCDSSPYCLRERASTLAGLPATDNPHYSSVANWSFGAPLLRARAYYAARLLAEQPEGPSVEELTDSACRQAFYEYALDEVLHGSYMVSVDDSVHIDLPSLPRNTDETRAARLYTDQVWPCTNEEAGRTLHCSLDCPGAAGSPSGTASLSELEGGGALHCEVCQMDVDDLGRVAAASTSIDNGFEYYWSLIVEAGEDYERARAELAVAEQKVQSLAEQGEESFSAALDQLATTRPTLCPPGAWGCVAVVTREDGEVVPTELTRAFLSSSELPAGAAVSAAALAPDNQTEENNVLARFFDGLSSSGSLLAGAADGVMDLWGSLLVGYGSAYGSVADTGGAFLDKVDGVLGGSVGSWLKGQLKEVLHDAGLEPVDMRLRKPALVNSQDVFGQAGIEQATTVKELVSALPDASSAQDFAQALGMRLVDATGSGSFTVAEFTVPGTSLTIPLTIDLSGLGDAA